MQGGGGDLTKSCTGKLKKNIPAEWIALCGSYLAATLYCNIYFLLLINGILTYQVFSPIRKPDIFLSQGSYILCTATLSWTLVVTLAKTYPYGYSVCTRRIKVLLLLLLLLFLDNHGLKVNNPAYQFVVWKRSHPTFPNCNSILECTGLSNEFLWTPGAPWVIKLHFLHLQAK